MTDTAAHSTSLSRGTARRRARPKRAYRGSTNLLYLPALLLFAIFLFYPLISGVAISFTNWDGYGFERSFVGLANYARLFQDPTFHAVLGITFIYGIGCTLLQQVLGLALALALNRRMRGRGFARTLIYLPVLVSPVVMGVFYYLIFNYNNGLLNDLVTGLGGTRQPWLSSAAGGITIIVAVNTLQFVGVSMIIYLAGLQSIPPELLEASTLDGAGAWHRFRYVVLPLLQPAFATSVVLNLIGGFKLFDIIQVLTGGGPGTSTASVSTLIGKTYFDNQAAGYSAAMGIGLFVIIAIFTLVANTLLNRRRLEEI